MSNDFTFAESLTTINFFDADGNAVANVPAGSAMVAIITAGISESRGTLRDRLTGEFIVGTLDQLLTPAEGPLVLAYAAKANVSVERALLDIQIVRQARRESPNAGAAITICQNIRRLLTGDIRQSLNGAVAIYKAFEAAEEEVKATAA